MTPCKINAVISQEDVENIASGFDMKDFNTWIVVPSVGYTYYPLKTFSVCYDNIRDIFFLEVPELEVECIIDLISYDPEPESLMFACIDDKQNVFTVSIDPKLKGTTIDPDFLDEVNSVLESEEED